MLKKILRVNMSSGKIIVDDISNEYPPLGGRGLTSTIIAKEVPANCHALSKDNKLIFAPGILTGTTAPCSGRLSVGAKSPLTGTIKESNVGGTVSQKIARLGYAAIVIEGIPESGKIFALKVDKESASLVSANQWRGLNNYALVEKLQESFGKNISTITIGIAGEKKMSMASVAVSDMDGHPARHAGRGGLGAVMGSKGLKAIIVNAEGAEKVKVADTDLFKKGSKKLVEALKEHPVTNEALKGFGTAIVVNIINEAGGLPTRNFSAGRFEGVANISGERMTEIINERKGVPSHPCHPGCVISCSNTYLDKNGKYLTSALEYETIVMNGSNLGIDDMDVIAKIDRLCDDIGIDTIETGATIGVAMEGGLKNFGDGQGAIELIEEIGKATPLGLILGNGAAVTGQVLGVVRVPVVKRQGLPAYDPRAVKGIGVTYCTSTMGADHTAGYAVATNVMNVGGSINPLSNENQVELSRNLQVATAVLDSAGLCIFIAFAVLDIPKGLEGVLDMLSATLGHTVTPEEFASIGMSVLKTEQNFNMQAGFTKKDDRLPSFFLNEKLAPHNSVFDISDEKIDKFFDF
jgi:aldehyde:ferredoxin oxidoreductase